jgi:glycosyltransferase EpsD
MKKVLFTATVDSHILQFHLPFLKMFKENGYEVHVATNGNEKIPYCDVKHVVSFERSPIKINNLKAIKQLKKICEKEKFDIIHTHTLMGSVVTRLAAKKARRKYNTRIIYTAHGFHFFKGAPIKNWILFYPVEKYLAKYTDTLITINQEDYELAKMKFNKRCKDIQFVPGVGIDEKKFDFEMTKKKY